MENWFVCFQNNKGSSKVNCFGGFNTALEADDYFRQRETPDMCNSTLIPTMRFFPKAWQELHIKSQYEKIFWPYKFSFNTKS